MSYMKRLARAVFGLPDAPASLPAAAPTFTRQQENLIGELLQMVRDEALDIGKEEGLFTGNDPMFDKSRRARWRVMSHRLERAGLIDLGGQSWPTHQR